MSYNPEDRNSKVSEEELPKYVIWPEQPLTHEEVRKAFSEVKRFIDCDNTIIIDWNRDGHIPIPNPTLRGKPIEEFLREEPYIVQTWGTGIVIPFFTEHFPNFPKPVLIIQGPPAFYFAGKGKTYLSETGKNFAALGITGVTIIDDMTGEEIHAPGCIILPPN